MTLSFASFLWAVCVAGGAASCIPAVASAIEAARTKSDRIRFDAKVSLVAWSMSAVFLLVLAFVWRW